MITVSGLTKQYGTRLAVDDMTFDVAAGRVTGFVGPNGAGKSTTMRMMVGLTRPGSGDVRYAGVHYRDLKNPARTVGSVLDARCMHPGRTARNHLRATAALSGIPTARAEEVLAEVGLETAADQRAGKPGRGRPVLPGRNTVTSAPSRSAGTVVASATTIGSISRPLPSRARTSSWPRGAAGSAGSAQMPDRSTRPAVPAVPAATAARRRASAGARSPAPPTSAPNPAQDAGTPVSVDSTADADGAEATAVAALERWTEGVVGSVTRRRAARGSGGAAFGMGGPVLNDSVTALAASSRRSTAASDSPEGGTGGGMVAEPVPGGTVPAGC
jgi:ABC transporter